MPEELYEVDDQQVIQAEDTNQLVRAVRALQQQLAGDAESPGAGDVHFQSGTDHLGTLTHHNTADRTYTFPDESGTVALSSQVVTDHGEMTGLADDDHPQYQTEARANAWLAGKTTDQLAEGLGNLYHTNTRVRQALGATSPLAYNSTNGSLSIQQANASQPGYLSSADWSAFNAKAGGTHSHSASDITAGTLSVARGGTGLSTLASGKLLYASALDVLAALTLGSTLAISGAVLEVVANSSTQKLEVGKAGSLVGTRKHLNLIEGSNVTLTVSDNAGQDRVDVTIGASVSSELDLALCQGRLTVTSGTPVPTSDVSNATTLYFAPFRGSRIALYDGSTWSYRTFVQGSLALSGLTSAKNYDVFVYWDSGTSSLKLELGSAWTNATTRATALGDQDGIPVKSGDATRRWVGILRATSATETQDKADQRFVFNAYNRLPRVLSDSTTTDYTRNQTSYAQIGAVGVEYLCDGETAVELLGTSVLSASFSNSLALMTIGDNSAAKVGASTVAFHSYDNGADSVQACVQLREVPPVGLTERWLLFKSSTTAFTVTAHGTSPSGSASPATSLGGLLPC